MTKLIAFCGTHGTGKSSTIKKLSDMYSNFIYEDTFKVSRTCQEKLGYSKLDEAYETIPKMKQFQELILKEKRKSDYNILLSSNKSISITERSYLDIAAYAKEWVTRLCLNKNISEADILDLHSWYKNYFERCCEMMSLYSGLILVYPLDNIEFEKDPNRADLASRDNIHNFIIDKLTSNKLCFNLPILHLKSDTLNERVQICINYINELLNSKVI
jgi:hypothetical protein